MRSTVIWIIPSGKVGMAGKREEGMDASRSSCEAFGCLTLGVLACGLLLAMAPGAGNCRVIMGCWGGSNGG